MQPGKCRACGGPLNVLHLSAPDALASVIRLTIRTPSKRRFGEFELCPRCVGCSMSGERASSVQAALLAELKALLR